MVCNVLGHQLPERRAHAPCNTHAKINDFGKFYVHSRYNNARESNHTFLLAHVPVALAADVARTLQTTVTAKLVTLFMHLLRQQNITEAEQMHDEDTP